MHLTLPTHKTTNSGGLEFYSIAAVQQEEQLTQPMLVSILEVSRESFFSYWWQEQAVNPVFTEKNSRE